MKVDQLNRIMRSNGRKLLRNTNQLYESALKSYKERNLSLLPYHPATKTVRVREENHAPVRTLTLERTDKNAPSTSYPRNHQQMAEQAYGANSAQLMDTVMQATRRRSMSSTGNRLPSYMYGQVEQSASRESIGRGWAMDKRRSRQRTTERASEPQSCLDRVAKLDLSILSGRSMSLPPRRTFDLSLSYALNKDKLPPPPACKHHLNAIEKTANAAALALAKRQFEGFDPDNEQLMIVDKVLKQRLAVRFDRQPAEKPMTTQFRFGFGNGSLIDHRHLAVPLNKPFNLNQELTIPKTISMERSHFQVLGERIRRFELIQFADGPVDQQAFNRRQTYARGRTQRSSTRQLPKQEPSLGYRNVLHTNHRQRQLNEKTRSQSLESAAKQEPVQQTFNESQRKRSSERNLERETSVDKLADLQTNEPLLAPLEPLLAPLGPLTPNWRPQQQQQQHELNLVAPERVKVSGKPSKGSVKSRKQTKSNTKANKHAQNASNTSEQSVALKRSKHIFHSQAGKTARNPASSTQSPPRLAEQLKSAKKAQPQRKVEEVLPQQPRAVKGAHHLLTASATHVSAYRRAFKDRQQIRQAELLHMHVNDPATSTAQKQPARFQRTEREHQQQQQRPGLPPAPSLAKYQPVDQQANTLRKYTAKRQPTEPKPQAKQPAAGVKQTPAKLAKPATAQRPEGKKPMPTPTPTVASNHSRNQQPEEPFKVLQLPLECTQKQKRTTVPRAAYVAYAGRRQGQGQVLPTSELEHAELLKRQQQHQLYQQQRQRRQLASEGLWRQVN